MKIFSNSSNKKKITGYSLKAGDFLRFKVLKKTDQRSYLIEYGGRKIQASVKAPLHEGSTYRGRLLSESNGVWKIEISKTDKPAALKSPAAPLPSKIIPKGIENLTDRLIPFKINSRQWQEILSELYDPKSSPWEPFNRDFMLPQFTQQLQGWFTALLILKDNEKFNGSLSFFKDEEETLILILSLQASSGSWKFEIRKNQSALSVQCFCDNNHRHNSIDSNWYQLCKLWKGRGIDVNESINLLRSDPEKSENSRRDLIDSIDFRI